MRPRTALALGLFIVTLNALTLADFAREELREGDVTFVGALIALGALVLLVLGCSMIVDFVRWYFAPFPLRIVAGVHENTDGTFGRRP